MALLCMLTAAVVLVEIQGEMISYGSYAVELDVRIPYQVCERNADDGISCGHVCTPFDDVVLAETAQDGYQRR